MPTDKTTGRISRRRFLGTAAIGLAAPMVLRHSSFAAAPMEVKLAIGTPVLAEDTAPYSSIPIARKYYEQEGLKVEMVPLAGAGLVGQLLIGKGAFMGTPGTSAGVFISDAQGASVVSVFNLVTKELQLPAVPVASQIKTVADFRGKRIGVQSLASGAVPVIRAMLRDAGMDPERDVELIPVGLGAQAASALFIQKNIDALGLWDGPYATITNIDPQGYQLRTISSPVAEQLGFQVCLAAPAENIRTQRQAVVGVARAIAKALVFANANSAAAVRDHYSVYPEQRDLKIPEADAVRRGEAVLKARLANSVIRDNWQVKKWGWHDPAEVKAYYDLLRGSGDLTKEIPDLSKVYTNDLIDDINNFDQNAIKAEALAMAK